MIFIITFLVIALIAATYTIMDRSAMVNDRIALGIIAVSSCVSLYTSLFQGDIILGMCVMMAFLSYMLIRPFT